MRLHTDKITHTDLAAAARVLGLFIEKAEDHGSRSHDHAFEIVLSGSSTRRSQAGNGSYPAATWDEWGAFMARLYLIDDTATWGTGKYAAYRDSDDFHLKTCDRFEEAVIPADTHSQHRWQYDHETSSPLSDIARHYCTKCSARMRRG